MTRARELAKVSTAYETGGAFSFRNKIINGAMEINQRGSSSYTNNGYTLDRWTLYNSGGTFTVSQQSYANGSKPAFGLKNFMRVVRSSPSAILYITQRVEDVALFDNVDITVSFYAKATGSITLPTRIMQEFGSGGSASVTVGSTNHSLTTTLQRFTATFTCPSLSGKTVGTSSFLEFTFDMPATTETIEISGVQLEIGKIATSYEARSYGTELILAQRYFQRLGGVSYGAVGIGRLSTGRTFTAAFVRLNQNMRAAPTASYSNIVITDREGFDQAISSINSVEGSNSAVYMSIGHSAVGVGGQPTILAVANGTAGYLDLISEL